MKSWKLSELGSSLLSMRHRQEAGWVSFRRRAPASSLCHSLTGGWFQTSGSGFGGCLSERRARLVGHDSMSEKERWECRTAGDFGLREFEMRGQARVLRERGEKGRREFSVERERERDRFEMSDEFWERERANESCESERDQFRST